MIQFAQAQMTPQIIALWQECFGDADAYVKFYLAAHDPARHIMVALEDGAPVSMLSILPAQIAAGGEALPAGYIYAVATAQTHRGKGLSSALQSAAHTWLRENGAAAAVTVPATESLYAFYHRQGFETAFYARRGTVAMDAVPVYTGGCTAEPLSAEQYAPLREQALADRMFVRWELPALEYRLRETAFGGGFALRLQADGAQAGAIGYLHGGQLVIKELLTKQMPLQTALGILKAQYPQADSVRLYLPDGEEAACPPERTAAGAICWYDKTAKARMQGGDRPAPYIGLVLD